MIQPYFIYELTSRCNNDCLYCYNVWKERRNYPKGELALPEIKKLFEKLLKEVILIGITLTGGEPLLHANILEISSFLAGKKLKVGIATNGILLDKTMMQRLTDSGVSYFEISLVSTNQETYSLLTGDEQLKKVKEAILNVKRAKAELAISFVLTKLNLADLEETIDLCFAF